LLIGGLTVAIVHLRQATPQPVVTAESWRLRAALPASGVTAMTFSPDGRTLAILTPSAIHLWDVTIGQQRVKIPGDHHFITFAPDSRGLVSGSYGVDRTGGDICAVHVWDTASGVERGAAKTYSGCHLCSVSADGHTLAGASRDGTLKTWDLEQDRE